MTASVDDLGGLILEVFRLNGCLIAEGDRKVAPFGLSSARWQVLGAVARSSEAQTVSQLAREAGVSRQAVQRIANTLIDDGLLEMADNPRDRRAQLVKMTEKGQAAYAKADSIRREWLKDVAKHFDREEMERAAKLLAKARFLLSSPLS